jgi:hypothetical protein
MVAGENLKHRARLEVRQENPSLYFGLDNLPVHVIREVWMRCEELDRHISIHRKPLPPPG